MPTLPIGEVRVGERRRELNESRVQRLAESIAVIGLLNPVSVSADGELVAGLLQQRNDDALAVIAVYEFAHAFAHTIEEEVIGKRIRWSCSSDDSNDKFHKTVTEMLSKGLALNGKALNDVEEGAA